MINAKRSNADSRTGSRGGRSPEDSMEHTAQLRDSTIHYWVYNPGKDKTLVMIHGFTGDHYGFQKIIPYLADYTIITPDLPGSGDSTITKKDWSIDAIARLTNEFVQSLRLEAPPYILGHSMGGLVVATMIHQAPHLYDSKVILLSPVPRKVTWGDSRWLSVRLGELQYKIGYTVPVFGPLLVKSKWITLLAAQILITTNDKEIIRFTREQMLNNLNRVSSVEFYYRITRDVSSRGVIDYVDTLRNKTVLFINGDKDMVAPLEQVRQVATQAGASFATITGVGHDIHYERANEAATIIKEFLTS